MLHFRFAKNLLLLASVLWLIFAAVPAHAQITSSTGAIQGTVADPSGSSVVGAKVVVTNDATGVRAEGSTSADGGYVFPLLSPGRYKIEIEAQGFNRTTLPDILVQVTKITVANAKLEIGQVSTEVVVTGAAQMVDTRTATTGDVISGEMIRAIPLPTRNFLGLLSLQPGVAASLGSPAALGRGTPELFVAGQRGTVNNFVLNGVDANNFGNNNFGNVPLPNPDAVQEFRVSTTLYDASQGRGSGGNINVVQRSGTDKFHGNGFEFFRSDVLNANDFFFNLNGKPKPVLLQNQFGGTIGGPVPKLKQTFWFFSYQGWRQKNGVAGGISGQQPVLPATRTAATLAAAFGLKPSDIDPVAVRWLNRPGPFGGLLYPSGTGAAVGQTGRFSFSLPSIFNENQYNATFDREIFHNNSLGLRFFTAKVAQTSALGGGVSLGQGQNSPVENWHGAIRDTHTFSSTLLNEFRIGFTLNRAAQIAKEGTLLSDIGMSRFNSASFPGTPAVFFSSGILSFGGISTNNDQASANLSYTIGDTLSWTRSKHTLRGGFETRRYHTNTFNNFASRGFLNFANFKDFLTGTPNDVFVGTGITDRGFRAFDLNWFVQDDYHVTRRLTLNLGLRYDFLGPSSDVKNRLGNFDLALLSPACRAAGGGDCLRAGFVSPEELGGTFGTPGVSRTTYLNSNKANFAPRASFAYDLLGNGKAAIRGGYGIYYIRTSNQTLLQLITAAPFFQLFRATGPAVIGSMALANPYPSLPTSDKFPILPIFPQFNGYNADGVPQFVNPATRKSSPLITINPFDRQLFTPYTQSWNLTVQYEFLKNWVTEAGYLGARGVHLIASRQRNQALLVNAANPGLGGLTVNSLRNASARVSIPGFSATGLNDVTFSGDSWYNAFVLSVRHPFYKGLQAKVDYTFSKSLDTNSGAATQDLGNAGGNQLIDAGNKGPSLFDQRHRVVITYLWDIPGPKGGWMGHALGGWSIAGSTIFQSGFPFSVISSGSASLVGFGGSGLSRANLVCAAGPLTSQGKVGQNINNYINQSCFTAPPLLKNGDLITGTTPELGIGTGTYVVGGRGTDTTGGRLFGNSGRGLLRGPFQQRWDFALTKAFPLRAMGEQGKLEFRSEFFKLFNTPIFSNPATNVDSAGTFGRISSTIDTTGRVIQFALKLNF